MCVCAFARDVVEFKSSVGFHPGVRVCLCKRRCRVYACFGSGRFNPGVGMRSSGLFLQTEFWSKSSDDDDKH